MPTYSRYRRRVASIEVRYKADFGALVVRARDRHDIGVNQQEQALLETRQSQWEVNVKGNRRSDPV